MYVYNCLQNAVLLLETKLLLIHSTKTEVAFINIL